MVMLSISPTYGCLLQSLGMQGQGCPHDRHLIVRDSYDYKADIVGMVAVDVAKIFEACLSLQSLWSGIFETLAVLAVLSFLIVLPAVGVMAVFLPLQHNLGLVVAYRKKALSVISTKCTTLMPEILRSIKFNQDLWMGGFLLPEHS